MADVCPLHETAPHSRSRQIRVLVLDNDDSFVDNLGQYLGQFGADCVVLRHDEPGATEARAGADAGAAAEALQPASLLGSSKRTSTCVPQAERSAAK